MIIAAFNKEKPKRYSVIIKTLTNFQKKTKQSCQRS